MKQDQTLKAVIHISGDPSVGIPDISVVADTGLFAEDMDRLERQYIRKILQHAYQSIHYQLVGVQFEDECGDCNNILPQHDSCCPSKEQ